jgi:hypothetical protein
MSQSVEAGRIVGLFSVDPITNPVSHGSAGLPPEAANVGIADAWQEALAWMPVEFAVQVNPDEIALLALQFVADRAARYKFPIFSLGVVSTRPAQTPGSLRYLRPGTAPTGVDMGASPIAVSVNAERNPDSYLTSTFPKPVSSGEYNVREQQGRPGRIGSTFPYSQGRVGTLHSGHPFVRDMEREQDWSWGGRMTLEAEGMRRFHLLVPSSLWLAQAAMQSIGA